MDLNHEYHAADLARVLREVSQIDPSNGVTLPTGMTQERAYAIRNGFVLQAVSVALWAGLPAGLEPDPKQPDWMVAYIDLPDAGQVSWHVPWYGRDYDGHSTAEKYERVRRYVEANG